jgi:long-subunit acyl-CoA synthetase (AMP-forming)
MVNSFSPEPYFFTANPFAGLTEASPTCFNAFTYDSIATRLTTVGALLPHLKAKIISQDGSIVPIGQRGELCISGYSLCKGYLENAAKTAEVMRVDEDGTLWLHTGDEAEFTQDGYAVITGRFKDIIIRGKCSPSCVFSNTPTFQTI